MRTQHRRAEALRLGDLVTLPDGSCHVVTSTRIEGPAGGVVSVGLSGLPARTRFAPGAVLAVHVDPRDTAAAVPGRS